MNIRLVSSLTRDAESHLAPMVLEVIRGMMDGLPVSYVIQIDTDTGTSVRHVRDVQATAPETLLSDCSAPEG